MKATFKIQKRKRIPDKRFIFEIPIVCRAYNADTVEQDFGSRNAYNPDFPEYVRASQDHIGQLFQDAIAQCLRMQLSIASNHKLKEDMATWPEHLRTLYKMMEARIKYYQKLEQQIKHVRTEIP